MSARGGFAAGYRGCCGEQLLVATMSAGCAMFACITCLLPAAAWHLSVLGGCCKAPSFHAGIVKESSLRLADNMEAQDFFLYGFSSSSSRKARFASPPDNSKQDMLDHQKEAGIRDHKSVISWKPEHE